MRDCEEGRKKNAKRLADNGDFLAQVNNFLQASIFYIFFLPFLVFFTVIDYLHGHPSSLDFPRLVI